MIDSPRFHFKLKIGAKRNGQEVTKQFKVSFDEENLIFRLYLKMNQQQRKRSKKKYFSKLVANKALFFC